MRSPPLPAITLCFPHPIGSAPPAAFPAGAKRGADPSPTVPGKVAEGRMGLWDGVAALGASQQRRRRSPPLRQAFRTPSGRLRRPPSPLARRRGARSCGPGIAAEFASALLPPPQFATTSPHALTLRRRSCPLCAPAPPRTAATWPARAAFGAPPG